MMDVVTGRRKRAPAADDADLHRTWNELLGDLDPSMVIATVAVDGERSGCLVGFATQCSIHPLRLLVCISHTNHTAPLAARAERIAVHVPSQPTHDHLVRLFGTETGDEVDKFAHCTWHEGPGGVPLLDGVACLTGRIEAAHDLGDHTAYVLSPEAGQRHDPPRPYRLADTNDLDPGHPA